MLSNILPYVISTPSRVLALPVHMGRYRVAVYHTAIGVVPPRYTRMRLGLRHVDLAFGVSFNVSS